MRSKIKREEKWGPSKWWDLAERQNLNEKGGKKSLAEKIELTT